MRSGFEPEGLRRLAPMTAPQRGLSAMAKSAIDRATALFGLLAASPLMAGLALAIKIEGHGPVLFAQERPGFGGRPFTLYKFRTMRAATGPDGQPRPDAERLTALGRFLRRTSLDEVPQLWNVLRGELSLVGPRPLLLQYLPRYSPEQARRHLVKPGITGWAQVNGRNAISWEEKFTLDVWYVEHWSLGLDLKILMRTITSVITSRGVSAAGHATMAEFRGSPNVGPPRV